ncbi:MAG: zinc ribbon domain-containing protein [Syntrophales bacterium]
MPIFDYLCMDCGKNSEILIVSSDDQPKCRECGSMNLEKKMSVPSSFSGNSLSRLPGPGDTACCGSRPADAGCAGPGSCCGKSFM